MPGIVRIQKCNQWLTGGSPSSIAGTSCADISVQKNQFDPTRIKQLTDFCQYLAGLIATGIVHQNDLCRSQRLCRDRGNGPLNGPCTPVAGNNDRNRGFVSHAPRNP
ncbi:MAG: hypothetical protein ACD_34C00135G0002 [uncultured bacterium]|nr:MAG: hypothetical protein ACD_34C00135G0002 [uncultured bacterium]